MFGAILMIATMRRIALVAKRRHFEKKIERKMRYIHNGRVLQQHSDNTYNPKRQITNQVYYLSLASILTADGSFAPLFSQKLCTPRRLAELTAYSWKMTYGLGQRVQKQETSMEWVFKTRSVLVHACPG